MKRSRSAFFLLVLGAIAIMGMLFPCASRVYAEELPEYRLGIEPTQDNLGVIEPGEVYSGEFSVRNTGKQAFRYEVGFTPYSIASEKYDVDYTKETKYTDIAEWIEVDKREGALKSGQEEELSYRISIPNDAHGGAQAATIMITMYPLDSAGGSEGIQIERRLGYLVFGNVDGDIIETGKVLENKVPSFLFNPPIVGTSLVENTGNVYTVAEYKLQVFPLFSDEEVYTNEEKPENNIIFPETKRYNEIKWEGAPQLGIFKVRQTVKIFDDESVTEKLVFLCPIWFLFIVILLIFLIIFWIVSRAIKRKEA